MQIWNLSATFTRPADTNAYALGDLIANSVTAGSVIPMAFTLGNSFPMGQFRLTRARLVKSGTTPPIANTSIRIHIYQGATAPTVTNGDNGAWLTAGAANWLGNVDITSMLAFSDGCAGTGSCPAGSEMLIRTNTGDQLFALLQTQGSTGTYTPVSGEVFTLTLEDLEAY